MGALAKFFSGGVSDGVLTPHNQHPSFDVERRLLSDRPREVQRLQALPRNINQSTVVAETRKAAYLKTQAKMAAKIVKERKEQMTALAALHKSQAENQQNAMKAAEDMAGTTEAHKQFLMMHGLQMATTVSDTAGVYDALSGSRSVFGW